MRRGRTAIGERRGPVRGLAIVALAGLGAAACGSPPGETATEDPAGEEPSAVMVPGGPTADSAAAMPDSATSAPDSATAADTAEAERPGLPPMPGEGAPREFRMLLVNPHERDAHVFASAGASRVPLDTVPAHDSTLVDVRVRADRILLEAEDVRGVGMGSIELDLATGETNRWVIGPPPGPRVASAGRRGPEGAGNASSAPPRRRR